MMENNYKALISLLCEILKAYYEKLAVEHPGALGAHPGADRGLDHANAAEAVAS